MPETKSIELSEAQQPVKKELTGMILAIESLMNITIDNKNGDQVAEQLTNAINLLSTTGKIMEQAKAIHNYVIGIAASEIVQHPQLFEAKQLIQSGYIKGRIAKYDALYDRAERVCKNLICYIDGLRSLLSYEKEMFKTNNYNQNT